ncbi:uncharacterized protein EDB93DRAFT_1134566 [Suillus bovinus]|uniref:uncharacterized protein n=1 Tax=Suillus bovinus TaxID=48563 RepID=UPI001B85C790|nr:uncharacterized protein EDB93DRAFT_1134566 [Suillus bovinus]KAG2153743.1 hypothetical protein EDB93DRAFT_1134566 [Suillus bovinus]
MSRRQSCRYYNSPGGCRRGTSCTFEHIPNAQRRGGDGRPLSPSLSVSSSDASPSRRNAQGPQRQIIRSGPPPRGVCRNFWETGRCFREFGCLGAHTLPQGQDGRRTPQPSIIPTQAAQAFIAPFLTEKGLSKLVGGGTDGYFPQDATTSLTPSETQSRLRRFLREDFRFKIVPEIYGFLVPLSSANIQNSSWTQEEGQLLLEALTSNIGRLRVAEIVTWPSVSSKTAMSREILSFQRGFIPLLRYMSSDFVVQSTLRTQANQLYMTVLQNLPNFADAVEKSMDSIIASRSFSDPGASGKDPVDAQAFASIAGVLHEFLVRFKNAVATYPRLAPLVMNLQKWFVEWKTGVCANSPSFDNFLGGLQPTVRDLIIQTLNEKIHKLVSIVEREQGKEIRPDCQKQSAPSNEGIVAALHSGYQGPGALREGGPRHDNDLEDIYDIRIAPTHEELMCRIPPFLPANFFGAPHPAPMESMQRLLDIQFRLLREELTAPLRQAVQLIYDDLKTLSRKKTKLSELLKNRGGKYRGHADTQDSLMFNVYTGVDFGSLVPDWRGISASIVVDAPPGRARSNNSRMRTSFWEGMSGKRLSQGGLIALVWQSGNDISVHLGVIASSLKDLTEHVKSDPDRVKLRIVFFDTKLELRILQELRNPHRLGQNIKLLVESSVMFEAIRPFLEALKGEPELVPFSHYLVHRPPGFLKTCKVEPPRYSTMPGFAYNLSCLFPDKTDVEDLTLSVTDHQSIENARAELRRDSRLDPSQADAVVDALTREVSLIQGPPGTGKSYTGVELLRVLRANNVGPILMIAFTNHALDHMLSSVLDADITKKVVRLGSRSADERISQYSIETLEKVNQESRLDRTFSSKRRELKEIQERIRNLMFKVLKDDLESDSTEVVKYISVLHPEHSGYLAAPPMWIRNIKSLFSGGDDDNDAGEWQQQGRRKKTFVKDMSFYAFWRDGSDLEFIETLNNGSYAPWKTTPPPDETTSNKFYLLEQDSLPDSDNESVTGEEQDDESPSEDLPVEDAWTRVKVKSPSPETADSKEVPAAPTKASDSPIPHIDPEPRDDAGLRRADFKDPEGFLEALGCSQWPIIPTSSRSLNELLEDVGDIWTMSKAERHNLHNFWVENTRIELAETQTGEFERLRELHEGILRECNEGKEEVRRNLLRNIDIIGCTTTGAAKLAMLLKGLSPRVLLVEEAGQVLEAHVLGSLVPSIEHLIMIGDPLQLRPTLNNFSMSMDSQRGRDLYKFDMSLMERLSSSGLAMSRIDVQRRMRPEISSLIRNTLYPSLEDHELVRHYPSVRGITKNLFFVNHNNRENEGAEDSASKFNLFEVEMIRELVLYLLRQGCYSEEGDIVVLCAYLGQLAKLRDALANEVAIVIDERDQAALADQEGDNEEDDLNGGITIEHVKVTRRVRLRTVDNYQGEEGRIVILSLVRNSGDLDDEMAMLGFTHGARPSIGFLKSENRTNVALSRAREGLFIFGNAANLSSKSRMWRHIIEELEKGDALGPALPIACHRHPETLEYVCKPGQLPQIAPDGGCMRPCNFRLICGHMCPFKCHSDDQKHASVMCMQSCTRLCARGHPCTKQCASTCGDCFFPVANVELPCGHTKASVPCHEINALQNVYCNFMVDKELLHCEHTARMACSTDPATYLCKAPCNGIMSCCGRSCNAKCHECQQKNTPSQGEHTQRTKHATHPCEKPLFCEHLCQEACSDDHKHTVACRKPCRQACSHARCKLLCSMPCAPCQESCTWSCPHHSCPVPCGSVCARLPCDVPCNTILRCGHKCPSVCGEDCDIQICPQCASDDKRHHVVDFILQRTLSEVTPESNTLDEMLITIPSCKHTFTVETLDGHCSMNDFYFQNESGQWLRMLSPIGFRKPPTCPTCRSPITAPRYGRIFKRADLDILEHNVAARMSRALDKVQTAILLISEDEMRTAVIRDAATIKIRPSKGKKSKSQAKARSEELTSKMEVPTSERALNSANTSLHAIDSAVARVWGKITHKLFNAYKEATVVAETRSAHVHAWESAFSFLYHREMAALINNPARTPARPQENAMRLAKLQVGQPRPLADRRFIVEAFWCTLHIRLTLITLGRTWLEEVGKREADYPLYHFQQWASYVKFMLQSCSLDVTKALGLARSSESHRQVTKTSLLLMRVELENFRFGLYMSNKLGNMKDQRSEMVQAAEQHGRKAQGLMRDVVAEHFARKVVPSREEEASWLAENFSNAAQTIVDEWKAIRQAVLGSTFYQEVSLKEQMEIVRAFNFGTTGHFYNCANGHTFVIGECGGAMQRSRCPECGSPVGGESHHLDSTNTRAAQYDQLARQVYPGIPATPWANPH